MKRFFLAILLGLVTTAVSATELPPFHRLPHWRTQNQCLLFSYECVQALHARRIPATQIFYKWQTPEQTGFHAAVIFQNEGSYWFMDNTRFAPRRVTAATDHGCIVQVGPKNTFVVLVDRWGNKVSTQRMDERFRKAGI